MGTAALVAGFPLMLFFAPYAEFYVFAKLIFYKDALKTTQNLIDHGQLFMSGVFAMVIVFMYDIVLAWALYIFLRPINPLLSLLTAWFRIFYTGVALVALFNFVYAYYVAVMPGIDESIRNIEVLQLVNARRSAMHLAYVVFGVYLMITGTLICKSTYIPKFMGVLMILAGTGWIGTSLQPYFFKGYNLSWMMIFGFGELIFAVWLLVKGRRIKESQVQR